MAKGKTVRLSGQPWRCPAGLLGDVTVDGRGLELDDLVLSYPNHSVILWLLIFVADVGHSVTVKHPGSSRQVTCLRRQV